MRNDLIRLFAVLLTSIASSAGLAHLFALPNKMKLSGPDYFIAQRAYDGWALFGIVMVAAIAASVAVAASLRDQPGRGWAWWAAGLMAAGLTVFFMWIFPTNRKTENWTVQPENWAALRAQWEMAHAVNAAFYSAAMGCIVWAVIVAGRRH